MKEPREYPPRIGQRWTATDAKRFEIMDLLAQEDDAWVTYRNIETLQEYSCRLEAFRARFRPEAD